MKKNSPPKNFLRFFRWFCHPKLRDHIEGDLMELYEERKVKSGRRKADLKFIVYVLFLFRPGIIRPTEGYKNLNNYGMFKSYFKIGWRNLLRNKGYSLINIGGLAIGMMVAILTGLWIWHEYSYDKYFANYDHLAQVAETGISQRDGGRYVGTTMTYPLSTELIDRYPQHFQRIARVSWNIDCILSSDNLNQSAKGLYVGDAFPEMLTFKMIQGTRAGLANMNSILVSESLAKSFFGSTEILNRTVRINNKVDVTITGVYEDFPLNTEFAEMRFFAPWSLFLSQNKWIEQRALTDWRNHFLRIFVQINPTAAFESVNSKVKNALLLIGQISIHLLK